jgi:hypothetical protein
MTAGAELLEALEGNYFEGERFAVRRGVDEAGVAWSLVLVRRDSVPHRLFGLRLLDYPHCPPVLRLWKVQRWDEFEFEFDFTSNGDDGSGITQSAAGVATICIPFHTEYYRNGWHTDRPWRANDAEVCLGELVENILRRV